MRSVLIEEMDFIAGGGDYGSPEVPEDPDPAPEPWYNDYVPPLPAEPKPDPDPKPPTP